MGKISGKSIADLNPAVKDMGGEQNLKGTLKVFLRTRKFREINEDVLKRPVSELYPGWKEAVHDFLVLRGRKRTDLGTFKKISEAFFRAYAFQSATECWSPATTAAQIAEIYIQSVRGYYEALCRREGIDAAHLTPLSPLRMDYVPMGYLTGRFNSLFTGLFMAASVGSEEFSKRMRELETGDAEIQKDIVAREQFFSNMVRWDLAHKALCSHLSGEEKDEFTDCVRLNEQFTIMNDLHGGFAVFNADLANKTIQRTLRYADENGKEEVRSAGWCWRQIGTLYLLLEQGKLNSARQ